MSDTATAVETVVTEAYAPTESAAPEIVRRDEVREQILNADWKEDAELTAPSSEDAPLGSVRSPDEGPEAKTDTPVEPPAEAVIGDGATRIVVRSTDGKFTPAPDVKLEFTVGDKTYLKTPAELVRMARDGVAGQQYVSEARQFREQIPQLQQTLQVLQQELEAQAALNRELLNDEGTYYERRSQWEQMNSPEARLARIEQERLHEEQTRRASYEQAQRQQIVQTYFQQELKPVQDEVISGYPEVSLEAKMGRISIDTLPLMVNGVIPPERLPEYKAYLAGPFREWVTAEAARVARVTAEQNARVQQTIQQSQRRAQQVVQSVGRQLAPNGKAAPDAPPPSPKPRTREEAKALIIGRSWQE